jgi:hypothetical protein
MNAKLKAGIRRLLKWPTRTVATLFPTRWTIYAMCKANQFLTSAEQVDLIRKTIWERRPCNVLIFGLGHDSEFYRRMNPGGRTVFLEHDESWLRGAMSRFPKLEAYKIDFTTRVEEWRRYMEHPERFESKLPERLQGIRWDIILVDAPTGFQAGEPGRMESIRLASVLIKRPGDVFVHDCDREVEDVFSTHYLKAENLTEAITNLRHYSFL